MTWRMLVAALALGTWGCGGRMPDPAPRPAAQPPPRARLIPVKIDCQPADAHMELDGVVVGTVSKVVKDGVIKLPPGVHRLEFHKAGFEPFRLELLIQAGGERLVVRLEPVE